MRAFLITVSSLFLVFLGGLFVLVWPNTYLSQINISYWPKPIVRYFLEKKNWGSIDIVVDGRGTRTTYKDLGLRLDVSKTMSGLSIHSVSELLDKWLSQSTIKVVQPVFVFSDDFDQRVSRIFPDRQLSNERVSYNKDTGLFVYDAGERKARVDSVDLQVKLITFSDFSKKPIEVEMVSESSELERKVSAANNKLAVTHDKPLAMEIQGSAQKISVKPEDILSFLTAESQGAFEKIKLTIDKEKVSKILADNGLEKTSLGWTAKMIEDNLTARFNGGGLRPVVLGADSGPNTDGSLADTYIEVDISQQKMFFFEKGSLFKNYNVSTGLNYPTPAGSYKIKNKLEMGFSSIFHVWMPWWMAFDYREDIGAYLGIHELPYKLVDGQKVYRFGNYIGNKKTGGCVALSPGEAKEVYDKSFPGMDLIIFE